MLEDPRAEKKKGIPGLIARLGSKNTMEYQTAFETLIKMGKPAVPHLIKALKHKRIRVWVASSGILKSIGAAAVPDLIKALKGKDAKLQERSAELLGKIKDKRAVPALINALNHPEYNLRKSAAEALGEMGDKRAIKGLIHALHDTSMRLGVRSSAGIALTNIGKPAVAPLCRVLLRDHDDDVRTRAAMVLGDIRDKRAVPALIKAMENDISAEIRGSTARILGKMGGKRSISALIKAMEKDQSASVRINAAKALANIKDRKAVPALIKSMLNDKHLIMRDVAAKALVEIGRPAVALLSRMLLEHKGKGARLRAVVVLGLIKDKSAVPALTKALNDKDAGICITAIGALGQMGAAGIDPLLRILTKSMNYKMRAAAAMALGNTKHSKAAPALIEALRHKNRDIRNSAMWALVALGPAAVTPLCKVLLTDPDFSFRSAVAFILGQIKDKKAVPALIKALQDKTFFNSLNGVGARATIIRTLGYIGDPRDLPALRRISGPDAERAIESILKQNPDKKRIMILGRYRKVR
jgi:HEAT repeat protein